MREIRHVGPVRPPLHNTPRIVTRIPTVNVWAKAANVGGRTGMVVLLPIAGVKWLLLSLLGAPVQWGTFLAGAITESLTAGFLGALAVAMTARGDKNTPWLLGHTLVVSVSLCMFVAIIVAKILPPVPFLGGTIVGGILLAGFLLGCFLAGALLTTEHNAGGDRRANLSRRFPEGDDVTYVYPLLMVLPVALGVSGYELVLAGRGAGDIANAYTNNAGVIVLDVRGQFGSGPPGDYVVTGVVHNEESTPKANWAVTLRLEDGRERTLAAGELRNKVFRLGGGGGLAQRAAPAGSMLAEVELVDRVREGAAAQNRARRAREAEILDVPSTAEIAARRDAEAAAMAPSSLFDDAPPTPTPVPPETPFVMPELPDGGVLGPRETYSFSVTFPDIPKEPTRIDVAVAPQDAAMFQSILDDPSRAVLSP